MFHQSVRAKQEITQRLQRNPDDGLGTGDIVSRRNNLFVMIN